MNLLAAIVTFLVSYSLLPVIIRVFKSMDLMDEPDRRKIHKSSTPSMGGISIFIGFFLTLFFFASFEQLASHKFFVAGLVLMFFLGLRDDIASLNANYKLTFQSLAAFLVVKLGGIELTGMYGLFGVGELNEWLAFGLSIFILIALTNAFNLIDGIDGLAGSLGTLIAILLGVFFVLNGDMFYALIAFSIMGGLIAFLFFNWHPARIFMGDTGSIPLGFVLTCLVFCFINVNNETGRDLAIRFDSFIALSTALLIVPIYDTSRVFTLRLLSGQSPFVPDKRHIHHVLLRQGFDHQKSTFILVGFNLVIIAITVLLSGISDILLIAIQISLALSFGMLFDLRLQRIVRSERLRNRDKPTIYISKSA